MADGTDIATSNRFHFHSNSICVILALKRGCDDGKNTDIIMETGLFNLTQDQTEALVHFGNEKTQKWLLVRLDQPKSDEKTK